MANYSSLSPNGVAESRRAPRLELMERIHGHLTSINVEVHVREISLGGLSVDAPLRFPAGAVHEFRLTLGDGSQVMVRGRVAHSTPRTDETTGAQSFLTGFEFLEEQPQESAPIEHLVEKVSGLDARQPALIVKR
jgi:hypothetical protein